MTKIWMLIWPKKVLGCQQTESGFYLGYKWQGKAIQTKARQNKGWFKATKERQIKKKYKPTGLTTDLLNHIQRKITAI